MKLILNPLFFLPLMVVSSGAIGYSYWLSVGDFWMTILVSVCAVATYCVTLLGGIAVGGRTRELEVRILEAGHMALYREVERLVLLCKENGIEWRKARQDGEV